AADLPDRWPGRRVAELVEERRVLKQGDEPEEPQRILVEPPSVADKSESAEDRWFIDPQGRVAPDDQAPEIAFETVLPRSINVVFIIGRGDTADRDRLTPQRGDGGRPGIP